jgi:hypothetical protein
VDDSPGASPFAAVPEKFHVVSRTVHTER